MANGNGKLVWTVMVGAVGLIVTLLLLWGGFIQSKVNAVEATVAARGERLTRLETQFTYIDTKLKDISEQLSKLMDRFSVKMETRP